MKKFRPESRPRKKPKGKEPEREKSRGPSQPGSAFSGLKSFPAVYLAALRLNFPADYYKTKPRKRRG